MSSKLVIKCAGTDGDVNFVYNYADEDATTQNVKNLCTDLVTNGTIFANPPTAVKSAKLVTIQESEYMLN